MEIDKILKVLESEGIPVFGIAPASLMENEEIGHRPSDILSNAKTIICYGIQIPNSIYQLNKNRIEMIWRAQNLLYRKLEDISLKISNIIENEGFKAIPTIGCIPLTINKKREIIGYINQIKMAVSVGMGVIGKNGMLLNQLYGPRLMLGGVITSAELKETCYPKNINKECPEKCTICIDNCPVKAIKKNKIEIMKCLNYTARIVNFSKIKYGLLLIIKKEKAIRYLNTRAFDEHTLHICSECVSKCPYGINE